MRRAIATGLIGLAILLCAARPASAQWRFIKWLEELSGPGEMWAMQFPVSFGCRWKDEPKDKGSEAGKKFASSLSASPRIIRGLWCDQNGSPRLDDAVHKNPPLWKSVRWFLTAQVTTPLFAADTGSDPNQYPQGDKKDRVTVWGGTAGMTYRLTEMTDFGWAVGGLSISGMTPASAPAFVADFTMTVRPLGRLRDFGQVFDVRLVTEWFPSGFELKDFGASGGALNGESEFITQISFNINVEETTRFLVKVFKR